jgi:sigma-B regulation protein RsbU (phosphoserine phosphatase)
MNLFALVWGPIGIAGITVGFFIMSLFQIQNGLIEFDFMRSYIILLVLLSLFTYFLFYFSYKLYYSFNFENKLISSRLNNMNNLIKFILVLIIVSAVDSYFNFFTLHASYSYFNFFYLHITSNIVVHDLYLIYEDFFFLVILNLCFSLLIISIFNSFNLRFYKPKKSKRFLRHSKTFNILITLTSIILIVQIVNDFLSQSLNLMDQTIFFNLFFIMLLVVLKPITKDVEVKKVNKSFNEFIIFAILSIYSSFMLIFILHGIISEYVYGYSLDEFIDNYMDFETTIQYIIFLIFTIIIVRYIQKNFSEPLHSIYKIMKDYDLDKTDNEENKKDEDIKYKSILNKLKNLSNSKYEIGLLAGSFKQMIENIELYLTNLERVTVEKEKITTELNIASKIQKQTIPYHFPPFPDRLNEFDIYASFNPAKNVGGDFYDYFLIDDDRLVVVIGDVSGKGVPAALFMMMAKALINRHAHLNLSLSEVFYQLNNQLLENNVEEMFATVWLGILEISTGKLTYVNAGHNLPYLFTKSTNQYDILESKPNFVLGGMENVKYTQYEVKINEGDRLYLYTDGITEGINQHEEEFSNDRLVNTLNNNNQHTIKDLILKINDEVRDFTKGTEQFDDETMFILEYRMNVDE